NFNRISAPDANSCAGCHNQPFPGGAGDIVANVFVLGQRFDFATFDGDDTTPTRGTVAENGLPATLSDIANSRATTSMAGSGYLEMLARQMTQDLQNIRNATPLGGSSQLITKGVSFGTLRRNGDGSWDASSVVGLPLGSVGTAGGAVPSLIINPWHQAGAVISLRQFTNNAMNHHHGIQTTERFGVNTDADGDGFQNEMTRADVTAVTVFQATLPVPGRVIPRDNDIEQAVRLGEQKFAAVGCANCHKMSLPLAGNGRLYVEPNPYNPTGNLRPGDAPIYFVNLNDPALPGPRLRLRNGVTEVPAFTDLKLHDITSGPDDPNREALNMQAPGGSAAFFAGNSRFLTKRLWGAASEAPYFHHGKFTTMRQAIENHFGESDSVRQAFLALPASEQDAVIEFLKTLQILPPGVKALIVDENFHPRNWP
nr:di-heme oxidoredictase family protein [Thermoanaerobaculia bacterium]